LLIIQPIGYVNKTPINRLKCMSLGACIAQSLLTLPVFECGEVEVRDISLFSSDIDEDTTQNLVDRCYLVQHPMLTEHMKAQSCYRVICITSPNDAYINAYN
jgi:hypothetical protein